MILMVGPFPEPINGCSLANQVFKDYLTSNNKDVLVVNTSSQIQSAKEMGRFTFNKMLTSLKWYKNLFLVNRASVVYFTPGQTFFGILKYSPFIILCLFLNKPYVFHIHGNHLGNEYQSLKGVKKIIFRTLISGASAGIVLSESLRPNFKGLLSDEKVHVVKNFAQQSIIPSVNILKNSSVLRPLYFSNLMAEKGIQDFLESLRILKNRGVSFKAEIAGKIEDESMSTLLSSYSDLNDSLIYHGVCQGEKKIKLLTDANVFVLPTYYKMEGQPISILEAMAFGNIVVTTKHAGIPDIIDERNGFFVSPKSPMEIADLLENISKNILSELESKSVYNQNYVNTNFTEKRFSDEIIQILNHVSKS